VGRPELGWSAELTAAQLRRLMISEFRDWLGSRTNRNGRPFQADTISAYADAAIALDAWMTAEGIEADFTACGTAVLNRFFAAYYGAHGQGGTNTKQRNLRHLFSWLEREHDHPHPYTDDLQRYTPAKTRPSTLAGQFITDLLEVTGNGRARGFEDARDHAMIRMLTEGVRRTELVQQQTTDLPVDVIAQPFVRVVPLKGARGSTEGRIVPLAPATARAIVAYLRVRRGHRLAACPALWLGTRNRGAITGSGLYRMLQRRAGEAGYDPAVHPHQFRHTFAHDWLNGGGAEGDLMRLMGWADRSMLDRYGADLQVQRAVQAKRRRGDLY
jgi:site-specific recombinase XerD